jgi:2-hydroxy-6-oxonona-2,4-dienedioate hydrolase
MTTRSIFRRVLVAAGIALAMLTLLIVTTYQRDIQRARERVAAGSQMAETPCGPIEYAVAGNGPPVLLVHGAGGGFDQALDFGAGLVDRGLRVIAMSRFGYLRTPLPADASAAAQADAHACLLDSLRIERATILGASAGAPSSLLFALRHPRRTSALVLLVPAAYAPRADGAPALTTPPGTGFLFDSALRSDFLFWAAIRAARTTVIRAILATPPDLVVRSSESEQARIQQTLDHILPVSPRRRGLLNDAAILNGSLRYESERIVAPTLIISAVDDLFGTYAIGRYTATQIPGARFIGLPDGGHLWVGHHQRVISEIAAFVTTHQPRR